MAKASLRQGPRPLPAHLLAAGSTWHSSRLALPYLKSASVPWKGELGARAAALVSELGTTPLPDFAEAVETELRRRADRFAAGIEAYRRHPYRRVMAEPPAIWQGGTTRLLDYGPPDGAPILVVPSLINRAYVLDLAPGRSLLRSLSARGLRPLLVDWDRPGESERSLDLTGYVAGRLDQAFEAALAAAGGPVAIIGYCMGGLLALALALRRQRQVSGLALLATPWDFHTDQAAHGRWIAALAQIVDVGFGALGQVPTDILQTLFFLADPHLAIRKFSQFAELDPAGPAALNFVETEDWLNDGVPLALPVARECFAGWYGANDTLANRWKIAGQPVDPARFERPALIAVPSRDRLVPPASALPLAARLPRVELLQPDLGHIGLVVGRRAPELVWPRLADWLRGLPAPF
jgi:polyhydroxyalkanoate synthase